MGVDRRQFLAMGGAALAVAAGRAMGGEAAATSSRSSPVDREALVRRHNPVVRQADPFSALSVGNGEFAFTADVTGLQTFADDYEKVFPLCTVSHWGWHTTPIPAGLRREDIRYTTYDTYGRPVGYVTDPRGQERLFNWLRENPHRLHLGRIAFEITKADGLAVRRDDLKGIEQRLELWTGLLTSRFEVLGKPVFVQTCCHPELDMIAVRVESPLLGTPRLRVRIGFPYGSPTMGMADWAKLDSHETTLTVKEGRRVDFERRLDAERYQVSLAWSEGAKLSERSSHHYVLDGPPGGALEFVCRFAPSRSDGALPSVAQTQAASAAHWRRFWNEGGVVELSGSTDARAAELERRIVLSQFLTAVHCAGSVPSQETGLLCNSWYGKFHLEMHWWHSVHFTAWNRFDLFEKSLGFYQRILPVAREIAERQGYGGVRWPKMIGPDGHDAPSPVGPLLIWQQPHPIYYAELCYRRRPTRETLERWRQIVFESAEFMAAFAVLDKVRGRYVLGPPMKTVSENTDPTKAMNPTFELAYWRFGLRVAQEWRERLGLPREENWDRVLAGLCPLPVEEGRYVMQEVVSDTYTKWNWEHPGLLGALGVQPGDGVDVDTMRRTVRKVMEVWRWDRCWGWDFPMAAMAAARVGEPELAVQALLLDVPKNRYLANGHNYQRPNLPAYLPGNGGLLAAVALMAAGWQGSAAAQAPGFPKNGQWSVRAEGLVKWM